MVTRDIRFGGLETRALFALEGAEAGFVTSSQLARMLRISRSRANKLAWQLARKNRLLRIKKGVFLFAPLKAGARGHWSERSLWLVSELMKGKPHYVGFWAALNHYGLTEQIPLSVQVVTTSRLRDFEALQSRFEFFQVKRLGEWREEAIAGKPVKIATLEQLIIDCLAYPEHCGGVKGTCKALWEARKTLDWKRLEALSEKSSDAVRRRLGYLTELLGLRRQKRRAFAGWRWLDPSSKKQAAEKSVKWGLLLNVSDRELTEWRAH